MRRADSPGGDESPGLLEEVSGAEASLPRPESRRMESPRSHGGRMSVTGDCIRLTTVALSMSLS